jgi:hypothetical protein
MNSNFRAKVKEERIDRVSRCRLKAFQIKDGGESRFTIQTSAQGSFLVRNMVSSTFILGKALGRPREPWVWRSEEQARAFG